MNSQWVASATHDTTDIFERIVIRSTEESAFRNLTGEGIYPVPPGLSVFGKWRLHFENLLDKPSRVGLFSSDGRLIFFEDRKWCILDCNTNEITRPSIDTSDNVSEKCLGAKGPIRVYGRENGKLAYYIYSMEDFKVSPVEYLEGHNALPVIVDFDVNSNLLISADKEGEVIVWNWDTKEIVGRVQSAISGICGSSFYPERDSEIITVNDQAGNVEILNFVTRLSVGRAKLNIKGKHANVWHSINGEYLLGADETERWDVITSDGFEAVPRADWPFVLASNAVSKDETVSAVKSAAGLMWVFHDIKNGGRPRVDLLPPPDRRVSSFAVSDDGAYIALMVSRRSLAVWKRADLM